MNRRPTRNRACKGALPTDADVNTATAQFSYHIETNHEVLTSVEEQALVNLLRESILESLIANHCKTSRNSDLRPGASGEQRGGDSLLIQENADLKVLSMFAKEVETTGMSDCPITEANSLSCSSYLSEVTLLYNYDATDVGERRDEGDLLQDSALKTIQQYMENGIYTAQINHELQTDLGDGTLEVTALTLSDAGGHPVPEASQNTTVLNTVGSNAHENSSSEAANPFWIFFGCLLCLLAVLLGLVIRRCRVRRHRHRQWKGSSEDTHTATLRTGEEETYDGAYLNDEDDLFEDETPLDYIESATLKRAESLTREMSFLTASGIAAATSDLRLIQEVPTQEDEEVEENTEYPRLGPEAIYVNTRKCQSAVCQACRRAADDDPNYLCPNYYTSEGVAMRCFDSELDEKSTTSFNIVPPSRVEKSRSAISNGNENWRLHASPALSHSRFSRLRGSDAIPRTVKL